MAARSRFARPALRRKLLAIESLEDRRLLSVAGWTSAVDANPGLNPPLDAGPSTVWTDPTNYGDEANGWDPLGGGDVSIVDPGNQDWRPFNKDEALADVNYYDPFDQNFRENKGFVGLLPGLPVLESNPAAPHTLYLNFTGSRMKQSFTDPELGSYDLANHHVVFDFDGDSKRFSDAEADAIYRIWRYVADDYAPFNVNVTTYNNTDEPALGGDRVVEVAIGGFSPLVDGRAPYGISKGYYNTSAEHAVFVFSDRIVDKAAQYENPFDAYEFFVKAVADTAAHESGHTYGLKHKIGLEYGAPSEYRGVEVDEHGPHTAIMGRPFAQRGEADARSLWAEGQTPDGSMQSDVALLSGVFHNGWGTSGLRPDDFPDANYFLLPEVGAGQFFTTGVIGANPVNLNAIDEDWLAFFNPGGPVQIHLQSPAGMFGNLHSKMELYAAHRAPGAMMIDGLVHASNTEASTNAFGSLYLPEGWYMINVASTGGYGNLGAYQLNVNAPGTPGIHVPGPIGEFVDVSAADVFPERAWQARPELVHIMGFAPVTIITDADMALSEIPPIMSSDFTVDGVVDGTDFLAWQRNLGRVDAVAADGDSNGDAAVDALDLAAWRAEFAASAAGDVADPRADELVGLLPPAEPTEGDGLDERVFESPFAALAHGEPYAGDANLPPAEGDAAPEGAREAVESDGENLDPWADAFDVSALDAAFELLA